MSLIAPERIIIKDAAGNTVAFLSPEADKIKDCWITRRINEEETLTFYLPADSSKLTEIHAESQIVADGREFTLLKPDAIDIVKDERGVKWVKVMAVGKWNLLSRVQPTINNDPDYPWPPNRKGEIINDPDYGWIVPDALVVCIISGGSNLAGSGYVVGSAGHALYTLLKDTEWELGTVDVEGTRDLETDKESLLANIQEVQKLWGGILAWEYVLDKYGSIIGRKLHLRDEVTWQPYNGFQIRYAKNLKHITRTSDQGIVTRLYPFGESDLDIASVNNGVKYVENFSHTDKVYEGIWSNTGITEPGELKIEAEKHLAKICEPRYTYRVKIADLRTLPEYTHDQFEVGDIVDIIDDDLGFNTQARIVQHRYNVFMPWQCELDVGEPEERLVSRLKDSIDVTKYVERTVKPNRGVSQLIKGIIDTFHTAIQGAQGDFEVIDGVATWWETDSGGRTGNLVRITPGGMLISDDGGQTSQLAITGKGIAAETIIGTLGLFAKVMADQIIVGSQGQGIPDDLIEIGPNTNFAPGYDPGDKFNAPGYVESTAEGIKVFDASDNLRVLLGSWLKDAIRKYGIKIIDGEIYSTTIQTGAESATTYIKLDPDGNFSAYKNGKRIIFMQASAAEGRIALGDGEDENSKLSFNANYDYGQQRGSGITGRNGLFLNPGYSPSLLIHLGSGIDALMNGKEFYVNGDHWVTGSKNAVMSTDTYGQRLLYSYEMPEPKFMDEGIAELENGVCRIDIDPIFLESVEPNVPETPFIIHLTPYDWLNLRVAEIGNSYFIVEEKEGLSGKFSWQFSAIRKGFAGERLRRVDDDEGLLTSNWEDDLLEFAGQEN